MTGVITLMAVATAGASVVCRCGCCALVLFDETEDNEDMEASRDDKEAVAGDIVGQVDEQQLFRSGSLSLVEPGQWERAEGIPALGSGSFGEVYVARDTATIREIAVKAMDIRRYGVWAQDDDSLEEVMVEMHRRLHREVMIMAKLRHKNIVAYLGVDISISKKELYIFMELVSGGSLRTYLDKYGAI